MWPPMYLHTHSSRCKVADSQRLPPITWLYEMRREMQEVLPGLFLGPYAVANKTKLEYLQSAGITHIVCVRQDIEAHIIKPNFPQSFQYLEVDLSDSETENLLCHVPRVSHFLDEALCGGGRVLVHGNLGVSRSAALVVAYVMRRLSLSLSAASELVASRRYCIRLNAGFQRQLQEYEPIYRAQRSYQNGHGSGGGRPALKRSHDQLEDDAEPMDVLS